ncbi:hypothetical protein [Draconibacterium sediminis]|uniref:DUF2975 domain-containing protein n=1 Tax=Draconibacterium sediminis TaxID=1544798 RepID=A0A0D8JEJ9_9BACT|nr:hypothetical protein [Draconibacterium sediminis]KJF45209.1 hypothetical protein LH29_07410 [Draconibacterium sediminis]
MDQKQSFNLNADFLGGFTSVFMKLVFVIIVVYLLLMILNFLRDKFINKEATKKKEDISDLLIILNKLFYVSGFGFVIANIFQFLLSQIDSRHGNMPSMNFRGEWEYLTFGIIIIFVGIGFKVANKILQKNNLE